MSNAMSNGEVNSNWGSHDKLKWWLCVMASPVTARGIIGDSGMQHIVQHDALLDRGHG